VPPDDTTGDEMPPVEDAKGPPAPPTEGAEAAPPKPADAEVKAPPAPEQQAGDGSSDGPAAGPENGKDGSGATAAPPPRPRGRRKNAVGPDSEIGQRLRELFSEVEREPIPARLIDLLEKLSEAERKAGL
jgi:hypothetical protein